jgi:hypothetical protein
MGGQETVPSSSVHRRRPRVIAFAVMIGTREDQKKTTCDAAREIVADVRAQQPDTVASNEQQVAVSYGKSLRRLAEGTYTDIDGKPSPELAVNLRTVADDPATAQGASPGEFITGKTGGTSTRCWPDARPRAKWRAAAVQSLSRAKHSAAIVVPATMSPLSTRPRILSSGTHSTRSASKSSCGGPICVAPSARKMWW